MIFFLAKKLEVYNLVTAMTEKSYIAAIKAGMAYTGVTRMELAKALGIHYDTLGRKLRQQEPILLSEMVIADRIVRWSDFIKEGKR